MVTISMSLLCTEFKLKEQQGTKLDLREDVFLLSPGKIVPVFPSELESSQGGSRFALLHHVPQDTTLKGRVVSFLWQLNLQRNWDPSIPYLGPAELICDFSTVPLDPRYCQG